MELPFELVAAEVTGDGLGRAIVIRRGSNQLYLYRVGTKTKLVREFEVATGRSQYPTPLGKFEVINKQYNPWWYPPAGSEWARGRAADPARAREPARNALDGHLGAVRRHPRHA